MSTHETAGRTPKTLAESVVCFGCTAAILTATAVVLKWLLHFLP
jgi:hypothetical protein